VDRTYLDRIPSFSSGPAPHLPGGGRAADRHSAARIVRRIARRRRNHQACRPHAAGFWSPLAGRPGSAEAYQNLARITRPQPTTACSSISSPTTPNPWPAAARPCWPWGGPTKPCPTSAKPPNWTRPSLTTLPLPHRLPVIRPTIRSAALNRAIGAHLAAATALTIEYGIGREDPAA
jgi:hypothetical protein